MKSPHEYQLRTVDALYTYFDEKDGHPLVGLPGGTGKSFVMAYFLWTVFKQWPSQRVVVVTHVHTLIEQNFAELIDLWPLAPAGICSAGLGHFNTTLPIVYAGIQTVVSRIKDLGHRDLVLIDEAHLLSPTDNTRYQQLIAGLMEVNPHLRVIGFSATNWRIGQGLLTDQMKSTDRGKSIFTDMAIDLTTYKEFNKFFDEGYLVPPISKRTETEFDLSEVHRHHGQFAPAELDAASNTEKLNIRVCQEICDRAHTRKSWLIPCASIDHANKIGAILSKMKIDVAVVHSKQGQKHNDSAIARWKEGSLRSIVTKDMCLVGVNNRRCDFLGVLRGMVSTNLWVQVLSRTTRTCPEADKKNSLVLDFAGNTGRLGPINDPAMPTRPGQRKISDIPIRICDQCGTYNHASARTCVECGKEFAIRSKLTPEPVEGILVRPSFEAPIYEWFRVQKVVYSAHRSTPGKPYTFQIAYHVGDGRRVFKEWYAFEGAAFPKHIAHDWWRAHSRTNIPTSTFEAVNRAATDCAVPRRISVWIKPRGYDEVMKMEF